MSARSGPQAKTLAAGTSPPVSFDHAFRERLRDLVVWRRDVRRFRDDPVPDGTLEALIELACLAPSVGLSQPWRFVIVENAGVRSAVRKNFETCNAEALAAQAPQRASLYARLKLAGLGEAPIQFAVFADHATEQGHGLGRHTMPEMIDYSAVTAVHTIWLAARARGLGLGWVSILEPSAVADALDVPAAWKFIGYFCLGYPLADDSAPQLEQAGWEQRRPASSLIIRR
jgi:5,6-dimethylbenzimidazole synthase